MERDAVLNDTTERIEKVTTSNIDVLIRGAKVVDGTGNPWYYGDIAIGGDRVLEVVPPGRIPAEAAREVVDAAEMVICPGFIVALNAAKADLISPTTGAAIARLLSNSVGETSTCTNCVFSDHSGGRPCDSNQLRRAPASITTSALPIA